jgi:hypothetical protein
MSLQKTMKPTSNLQKLYLSFLLFNLLMNNHQFLVILSLEHILTLIVANIDFHRSQNLSLFVILRHIRRAYKYKKNQPYSYLFSMPNIMYYTRLVLPFSNKKV